MLNKIQRLPSKLKREFLRIPSLQLVSERAYQKAIKEHIPYLPSISPVDFTLLESLEQEGVFITSLEKLSIPSTSLLVEAVEKLMSELRAMPSQENHVIVLPDAKIADYPEIITWGLEERLLDIIENYLGMPVRYYGPGIRREIANGETVDVRQWHRDTEDRRIIKIIIYFNDVNINGGPFEYIPKSLTTSSAEQLRYYSGFVADPKMNSIVPSSEWKPCTGAYGTVVFADTGNVFHRAKAPIGSDRFSITYGYTSIKPIASRTDRFSSIIPKDKWQKISARLTKRQIECC